MLLWKRFSRPAFYFPSIQCDESQDTGVLPVCIVRVKHPRPHLSLPSKRVGMGAALGKLSGSQTLHPPRHRNSGHQDRAECPIQSALIRAFSSYRGPDYLPSQPQERRGTKVVSSMIRFGDRGLSALILSRSRAAACSPITLAGCTIAVSGGSR